jgi:hypothetical protein
MQARAVTWLVNRGGLWVAHERPNLRPPGVERRHVKLDWETMPFDHPAGILLNERAYRARAALDKAAEAIDRAVLPGSDDPDAAGHLALVGNRIVWEAVERNACSRKPEDAALGANPLQRHGIPR